MRYVAQMTPIGELRGRDAIYLDSVVVGDSCNTLTLTGEFNGALATIPQGAKWHAYRLEFKGVIAFQVTELEAWQPACHGEWPRSSFDEILESPWKESLSGPMSSVREVHRHVCLLTYDRVFDVLSQSCELVLTGQRDLAPKV